MHVVNEKVPYDLNCWYRRNFFFSFFTRWYINSSMVSEVKMCTRNFLRNTTMAVKEIENRSTLARAVSYDKNRDSFLKHSNL